MMKCHANELNHTLAKKDAAMIRHLVFMRFKKTVGKEDIKNLEDDLSSLPTAIPGIESYEFGRNVSESPHAFDFALVSTFSDQESLAHYQTHPAHMAVIEKTRQFCTDVAVVDYPVGDNG
jgi:hypothetical protein